MKDTYSTCAMCGTLFVYKKKTQKGCVYTKTVYELRCPHCNHMNDKISLNKNKRYI